MNDIDKTLTGKISSFALLSTRRWVRTNTNPLSVEIQTITKEYPLSPSNLTSLLFLTVMGVLRTGDINRDIYATPEYEAMIADFKKGKSN